MQKVASLEKSRYKREFTVPLWWDQKTGCN